MMEYRIESVGEGKYKMLYQGHSPYPANPYTVWWPCLRQEPNGCNWEYRLTKDEVMERLEKQL